MSKHYTTYKSKDEVALVHITKTDESKSEEFKLLEKLYKIQSPSKREMGIMAFLSAQVKNRKDLEYRFDTMGNLLITKGELKEGEYYPCLVAHTDTVHDFKPNIRIHTRKNEDGLTKVFASYERDGKNYHMGGCGDDKNGVWIALLALDILDKVKVILTVQEEIGCIGATNIDQEFLADIGYYIEGDRKGNSDIITDHWSQSMVSKTFLAVITEIGNQHGYEIGDGTFTDICDLFQMNAVSAINVSVGYYNAHLDTEYTIYEELEASKDYILDLVDTLGNIKYDVDITQSNNNPYYGYDGYDYGNYEEKDENYYGNFNRTDICNGSDSKKDKNTYGNCSIHEDEFFQDMLDADCKICNPIITSYTSKYCGCGQELQKRKYSYFCPVCSQHKLDIYAY